MALRKAEAELERYRAEDSDAMRSIYAMEADYAVKLREAEENGYTRGLRDGFEECIAWIKREMPDWPGIPMLLRHELARRHAEQKSSS